MEANRAREVSRTSAERMRLATEAARANEQAEAESELEALQASIDAATRLQRGSIDKSIHEASLMGRNTAYYLYTERISASRKSRDEVAFIETIADITTASVIDGLVADGFEVASSTVEEVDPRDRAGAQPEYYVTSFSIKW